MKSKPFHAKLFCDPYIQDLNSKELLIFIYYVFNDRVNWLGTYEISDKTTIFELPADIMPEELKQAKSRLQVANKIMFYKTWVILKNSEKYDTHTNNIQLMKSAYKQYLALPEDVQEKFWDFKLPFAVKTYKDMFRKCSLDRSLHSRQLVGEEQEQYQYKEQAEAKEQNKAKIKDKVKELAKVKEMNAQEVDLDEFGDIEF